MVSITLNWFVAVGCNIFAQLIPVGSEKNTSVCGAMCVDNMLDDAMSACSGIGLLLKLAVSDSVEEVEASAPQTVWRR